MQRILVVFLEIQTRLTRVRYFLEGLNFVKKPIDLSDHLTRTALQLQPLGRWTLAELKVCQSSLGNSSYLMICLLTPYLLCEKCVH